MSRQPIPAHSRAWVEVDLGALRRNGAAIIARTRVPLLGVIKADGYGLGSVRVAAALEPLDPWGYGVAAVAEGVELRESGVTRPILVLSPVLPDEYPTIRQAQLRPSLGTTSSIGAWQRSGGGPWHLAIDTGMSRAGMQWTDVGSAADVIAAADPEGAYTHFHSADCDDASMPLQVERFRGALATLRARPRLLHAENSPAVERCGARSVWDLVRPGVFLYGVGSNERGTIMPEPVVSMRARVVEIREIEDGESVSYTAAWHASGRRRIATLAIGYADGYRRALSNRGIALVRGVRAPIVGIVTMDMIMLDVTGMSCEVGDVATLLGRDGDDEITIAELGRTGELLTYEILVGLKLRAPRIYVESSSSNAAVHGEVGAARA